MMAGGYTIPDDEKDEIMNKITDLKYLQSFLQKNLEDTNTLIKALQYKLDNSM